jgi:tellurite resistance-related uncharacterized protein
MATPKVYRGRRMNRPITGFHADAEGHWVAELDCGHAQHVRHDPPFVEREWVRTPEGRRSRLGAPLDCVRCDRREIPAGYAPHRRTDRFTRESVPEALLRRHTTKRGVWARIHVVRGRVEYHLHAPFDTREVLEAGAVGTVVPEVEHHVAPVGDAEFFVEFWRRQAQPAC